MADRYDVVVLGMGPGGEVTAGRLIEAGKRVAVVERELIGGECAYWACIPSKTLLRPTEARSEAARSPGLSRPDLHWAKAATYRDDMVRHLDDGGQVQSYENQGATVLKAAGRLVEPGVVEADGHRLEADHVVIATGSDPLVPPIEGLHDVGFWTNREATTFSEVPGRAVVIGGGPVGVELAQLLSRLGAEVTVVEMGDRLMGREDPRVGELVQAALEQEGISVRVGRSVQEVAKGPDGIAATLDDGSSVVTDVVVVGAGRSPRVGDIGLEAVGIEAGEKGLAIDERCRLGEGLWAVGDVTGVMAFTHVAQYQGRVVADNILGRDRTANYRGIPRVAFSDPEVAAVGLSEAEAREQGLDVTSATVVLPEVLARPWTYEEEPRGEVGLLADRGRRVLVGAWAVAPLAGEWIHLGALAIRAEIPVDTLTDYVAQFPTYSEAYLKALERLEAVRGTPGAGAAP